MRLKFWRCEPDVAFTFTGCHACIERRNGRWFFYAGIQYWDFFVVEVSEERAQQILADHEVILCLLNTPR